MPTPIKVLNLIESFERKFAEVKDQSYKEASLRKEFIDPFFRELGWDIENEQGHAEAYKDVIHEDAIKVEGTTKAPDYSFRIGGQRKFFLEAKKPSVNLKDDLAPAYQVRRYAWNAGLPISILTDFEEFAIYDTTVRPNSKDKASIARIFYCTFREYAEHWDYIVSIFSKDAILKGSFDKFTKDSKKKKGTTAVDKEFLKEMEKWRTDLAKNIALRNSLDIHGLNYAVQATIDRILFLRICEDRQIEEYGRLQKISEKENIYKQLTQVFEQADEKYNSGLFHFRKEKGASSTPDEISLSLSIDDRILKEIISALYYPAPWVFSVISADILGNVYEQFLGKVIRLTSGGQAKVEEKPEVKKAGGVFYTPQYIVAYMVENTVGELLKAKTPMMVAGKVKGHPPLRILDPACGSGSFLIYAYQYLLNWHRDWYEKDIMQKGAAQAKKWAAAVYQGQGKHWYLTTREKKQILLNNIFGVDIDNQAVEVTKLNLLLKVLEGENRETLGSNLKLFQERALPDLAQNIKCGNSLIASDFYTQNEKGQKELFEANAEEKYKVNAYDWEKEFSEIFSVGGFDAVIGNPPYVLVFNDKEKSYIENKFPEFQRNNDLYVAFVTQSLRFVKDAGCFAMITPNSYVRGDYFRKFRELLRKYQISFINDFRNIEVFENANVFCAIISITKAKPKKKIKLLYGLNDAEGSIDHDSEQFILLNPIAAKFAANRTFDDLFFIKDVGYNYWSIGRGKVRGGSIGSRILYNGKKQNAKDTPYIKGGDITRYSGLVPQNYLRHDYDRFLEKNDIFRYTASFLETKPKLIYRQTSSSLIATLDSSGFHNDKTVHIIVNKPENQFDLRLVLAIFNSKLLGYLYKHLTEEVGRAFAQVKTVNIKRLPFPNSISPDQEQKLLSLVDQMFALTKQSLQASAAPQQTVQLERQIAATNSEIDRLVYELYDMTPAEVQIVEGSN